MPGFELRHEQVESAAISLIVMSRSVHLYCLWPLDRETDEWFRFEMTTNIDDYLRCMDDLSVLGTGVLSCEGHMSCSLIAQHGDAVAVEMTVGTGSMQRTLFLDNVTKCSNLQVSTERSAEAITVDLADDHRQVTEIGDRDL